MKPERWRQVDQLFQAALERAPEDRSAFINEACGDDDSLRREVEALLAADGEARSLIETPAYAVAAPLIVGGDAPTLLGKTIGHYQIISLVGKGGMGEVYRAEDTHLRREVAIKVLPDEFAKDVGRLRRFEQEARAASALNHPNILTIHEIGEVDGAHYIVSEFVEGETLRALIERGRLDIRQAIVIAEQAAGALSVAHGAGIIHRDIKPENVMVRPDGLVKVLDFGLAKLTERPAAAAEVDSQAETIARLSTETGVVMGTASYMSPEQTRGQKVDARTDIFSLGVVLYEMIAGRRPFEGATTSDVMAAILTTEPAPLSQHAPKAPPELERIVAKALRKDREERYQIVTDLLVDLKDLKRELELETKSGRAGRSKTDAEARATSSAEYLLGEIKRRKRGVILALAALLVIGASIAYWLFQLIDPPAAPPQAMKITRLTHTGKAMRAAISPDGKYVAHVMEEAGRQSLWLRHIATNSDTQIVAPAEVDYSSVTFSPDGNFLYYVRGKPSYGRNRRLDITGALYKATILGKDEKRLIEKVTGFITFSPDGNLIAFLRSYPSQKKSALIVANVDGTGEKELATRDLAGGFGGGGPAWSPDGKIIVCDITNITPITYRSVVGVRVADGVETPITSHRWDGLIIRVVWLPDGSGLLVIGAERNAGLKQVWRLSWPDGKAQKLTNDLSDYADLSLTADSATLATAQTDRQVNIWIAPGGDASRAIKLTSGAGREDGVRCLVWTPDSKIVYRSLAGAGPNVWIMEADGTGNKQLSFNDSANLDPAVSADGRHIAWTASPKGARNIWRMDIDGGNPKQLTAGIGEWHPQYSPDGKWLVYAGHSSLLWKTPLDGGAPVQLTSGLSWRPSISLDGKLIAFNRQDEASGQFKIAVMPFEGGEPIKVFDIPAGPYRPIVWTPDGRAVAYPATRGGISNIWAQPLNGGPPKQLTDFREGQIFDFAWSRDGKQLALSRGLVNSDVVLISNFK
jgi:serine/threonine protein kinase/Tol biopolymer transport system component